MAHTSDISFTHQVQGSIILPEPGEIRDQILQDIELGAIENGLPDAPIQPNSEFYAEATSIENALNIGLQNTAIGIRNQLEVTATGDKLNELMTSRGVELLGSQKSLGRIEIRVTANTTILQNQRWKLPNGKRVESVKTVVNPADFAKIWVRAVEAGEGGNAEAGTEVEVVGTVFGIESTAVVDDNGLTGGIEEETDERKRTRVLNAMSAPRGGGNWTQLIDEALKADLSIQDAFVYPALGGPSSQKIVIVRAIDPDKENFSRACTDAQLFRARSVVWKLVGTSVVSPVATVVDENIDLAFEINMSRPELTAGSGDGWFNVVPWPNLVTADNGRVLVTSSGAGGTSLTVAANTGVSPVALITRIAWWSSADQKFYTSLVTAVSGSAGAWVLTLQTPLVDSNGDAPAANDFISPAAVDSENFGATWVRLFNALGPGENVDTAERRRKRHPYVENKAKANWTDALFSTMLEEHPEMTGYTRTYASQTDATIPAAITTAPNILNPRHLGLYEAT